MRSSPPLGIPLANAPAQLNRECLVPNSRCRRRYSKALDQIKKIQNEQKTKIKELEGEEKTLAVHKKMAHDLKTQKMAEEAKKAQYTAEVCAPTADMQPVAFPFGAASVWGRLVCLTLFRRHRSCLSSSRRRK